jgi:hypothetical protein
MTLAECEALIERVCHDYNLGVPSIGDGRSRRRAAYRRFSHHILLPRWARTTRTVLHEVAHAIADGDGHGPIYARVFADLLVRYAGIDKETVKEHAKKHRVRMVPGTKAPKPIPPRRLGRIDAIRKRLLELESERSALQAEKNGLLRAA